MLNPQPKEKIAEIIDRLIAMNSEKSPNQFELMRIKQEVTRLLKDGKNNTAQCYMALGFVAYFFADRVVAEDNYKNATRLEPGEPIFLQNYAVTCASFASFRTSIDLAEKLVARFPHVKSAMRVAIRQMLITLQIDKAEEYLAIYQTLIVNDSNANLGVGTLDNMTLVRQTFNEYNVTDDHVLELLVTAVQAVRDHGYEVQSTSSLQLRSGGIIYYLYIDADIEKCAETSFHIADALVNTFDDSGMEYLSILCRSLSQIDRLNWDSF